MEYLAKHCGDKKVVCVVQARMGSSRLPGKVMMPVLSEPMIALTLKRLKKCKLVDEIVLATSDKRDDDALAAYALNIGFECFRGSEDNVLERYVMANRKYGGDVVIRVTGDCPLIEPALVDLAVGAFLEGGSDYVSIDKQTAVRGIDTEVFSASALEKTYAVVESLSDFKNYKEHVTIYMYTHPQEYVIKRISAGEGFFRDYRLCVDEPLDFDLITAIFEYFGHIYPSFGEVLRFLDENPDIARLNMEVEQKKY